MAMNVTMPRGVIVLMLGLLAAAVVGGPSTARGVDPAPLGFVKGHSWGWVGSRGEYAGPAAADSMRKLADTGANFVCIAFGATMRSPTTPDFTWGDANRRMVADAELRRAIALARENNLKVIVKPVVNCADGTWRAWIKFFRPVTAEERAAGVTGEMDPWSEAPTLREGEVRDLAKWDRWWTNYREFLLHYARIAQEEKAEMFCLGCEMNSTEEFEDRWRETIADVRDVYDGVLTYDCNHGRESQVAWWDAVDVLSVSAYYQVSPPDGQSLDEAVKQTTPKQEIAAQLNERKQELAGLAAKYKKPILFIETGVTNVRGCARYPWSHPDEKLGDPLDQEEQVNYYEAMFETFWDEPWFMGFAWWDWPARLYDRDVAARHRGFCIYGKAAEAVVRLWYAKPRP
jgi:hypothetical protein